MTSRKGCYQTQQLYSYSLSAGFFSRLLWILMSTKGVQLIWQCSLTHDGDAPAFVTCDGLNHFLYIIGVVGN